MAGSVPRKHHYLPKFYLNRWASSGETIWRYRRPAAGRAINVRRVHPSGEGYLVDLYAIPTRQDPVDRQHIEANVMAPLDDAGANALSIIEAEKGKPRDAAVVAAWTRFVLSLLFRTPSRLAWAREQLRSSGVSESGLDEMVGAYLEGQTHTRWVAAHMATMRWWVHEATIVKHAFVTSDEPVMLSNGIGRPDGFLVLPIGPRRIFVAANHQGVIDAFASQPTRLERGFNDAVVRQASQVVIGDGPQHRTFVERRLGLSPPPEGFLGRHSWASPVRWV